MNAFREGKQDQLSSVSMYSGGKINNDDENCNNKTTARL